MTEDEIIGIFKPIIDPSLLKNYHCEKCDVAGKTELDEPLCWNCGEIAKIVIRPFIPRSI